MYHYCLKNHPSRDFFGVRARNEDGTLGDYEWTKYSDMINEADAFGSGLRNLELCPEINDFRDYNLRFLSIFAPNCRSWYCMDIAAMLHGITLAPLYATLGPKTLAYVLNQTKVKTLGLTAAGLPLI